MKKTILGAAIMRLRYANLEMEKALSGSSNSKIYLGMNQLREALDAVENNSTVKGIDPTALSYWENIYSSSKKHSFANLETASYRLRSSLRLAES